MDSEKMSIEKKRFIFFMREFIVIFISYHLLFTILKSESNIRYLGDRIYVRQQLTFQ